MLVLLLSSLLAGDTLAERVEAYVQPFVASGHLAGTILIARDGEIVFERSYGMADYELGVPNAPDTRFCVASITKPMTQVICVQLLAEHAMDVKDPISNWIEDFPRGDDITIEMLLNHRAGLPHRVTCEGEESRPMTAADVVELVRRAPPIGEPGGKSVYSSAGYSVLARVLELVAGKSYAQLLGERLFTPAGMVDSCHVDQRTVLPRRARSYFLSASGLENAPLKDLSFLVGAGSVWSTPRDLHRMLQATLTDKLGASVKASLLRPEGVHWNGITNGFRAFLDYDARARLTVIFAGNVFSGAADRLHLDLPHLASGEAVAPPKVPSITPIAMADDVLRRYEGKYEINGSPVSVRATRGGFYAGDRPLVPVAENSFFSFSDYGTVTIDLGADGRGQKLTWKTADTTLVCPRVGDLDPIGG